MALVMLRLVIFMAICQGTFSAKENTTNTSPQKNIVDNLECVYQITGVFNGQTYDDNHREAETCEDGIVFCQKITGHYFEVAANTKTEILMKGCDGVSIPQQFEGIPCQKEGCFEKIFEGETYNVCCCNTGMCNASPHNHYLLLFTTLFILLL